MGASVFTFSCSTSPRQVIRQVFFPAGYGLVMVTRRKTLKEPDVAVEVLEPGDVLLVSDDPPLAHVEGAALPKSAQSPLYL